MTRKPFRRVLVVEGLEDRQLMAGDVAAVISGQVLTLTGDVLDNGITITGLSGQVQVTGFEQGGADSTVNGNHRVTFKNVRKVIVDLGLGDDALVVTNLNLTGSVTSLASVTSGVSATSSVTAVTPTSVALAIQMGDGDDIVGLGQFDNTTGEIDPLTLLPETLVDETVNALLRPLSVSRDVTIDLGDGENILRATAVTIGGSLTLTAGVDDDSLRLESRGTFGVAGFLRGVAVGLATTISSDDGDDELKLERFSTKKGLNLSSGAGNNIVHLANVTVTQDTTISGGDGYDSIKLDGYSTRRLQLSADDGDDDVFVRNVRTTSTTTINGGAGDNIYYDLGGNAQIRSLRLLNFETIIGTQATSKTISRVPAFSP